MQSNGQMITLAAAAQTLGMSYERAKRLVLCGDLEGHQEDGRWWKVSVSSIERFKQEHEGATAGGPVGHSPKQESLE